MRYLEKLRERRRWEEGQLELKKGDERIVPSENEKPDVERWRRGHRTKGDGKRVFNLVITSPLVRFSLTLSGSR